MAITFRGAGAGAAANNAAVTPALFESPTAGDLLLGLVTIRDNGSATTFSASAGWSQRFQFAKASGSLACLALFYKVAAGGDGNPTFTPTGGASNDTVIGQCCSFRGVHQSTPFDTDGSNFSSDSAQDIGAITGLTPAANDAAVIVCGAKGDDWTSVATLSGDSLTWNEIGEPSSTTGTDAGLVWDYAIISGAPVTISSKTFTVTGGVAKAVIGKMTSIQPPAVADPFPYLVAARR